MENFINIMIEFEKQMYENIVYKLKNNKKLEDVDYMYIDLLIREKKRRDRKRNENNITRINKGRNKNI